MKQRIRLTESDLRNIVREAINELDWKTYANAANKSLKGNYKMREKGKSDSYKNNRAKRFADAAVNAFNQEFGYDNRTRGHHQSYNMDSYLPTDEFYYSDGTRGSFFERWLKYRNIDIDELTNDEIDKLYNEFLSSEETITSMTVNNTARGWDGDTYGDSFTDTYTISPYKYSETGEGDEWDETAYPDKETIDARNRGNREVRDFKNGKYHYEKGEGWKNRRKNNIDETISRVIRNYIR